MAPGPAASHLVASGSNRPFDSQQPLAKAPSSSSSRAAASGQHHMALEGAVGTLDSVPGHGGLSGALIAQSLLLPSVARAPVNGHVQSLSFIHSSTGFTASPTNCQLVSGSQGFPVDKASRSTSPLTG